MRVFKEEKSYLINDDRYKFEIEINVIYWKMFFSVIFF